MRLIVLGVCLFAGACSGQVLDSPTSPSTAAVAPGQTEAQHAVQLSFRGTFTGESRGVLNCPPTCPPTILRVTGTDTGEATHLGHFSAVYEDEVDSATATGTGTFTLTAANGDKLFTRYVGGQTEFVPTKRLDHHLGGHDHGRDGSVRRSHRDVYDHTHRHR
jgi:hypothetical protein